MILRVSAKFLGYKHYEAGDSGVAVRRSSSVAGYKFGVGRPEDCY